MFVFGMDASTHKKTIREFLEKEQKKEETWRNERRKEMKFVWNPGMVALGTSLGWPAADNSSLSWP